MIYKTLEEWSDDDNNDEEIELSQPNRDFPISDNEEESEEEEYDMYELAKLTANKSMADDLFKKEDKTIKDSIKEPLKLPQKTQLNIKTEQLVKQKRKFNPRLPPPNKYNKRNNNLNIKLNLSDFPSLTK
jgi:hypothetical protein